MVILTDQLRADCLGAAGNVDVSTPHLDALAGDGVHFTQSYCAAPLCTPSRYSLMTGYLPHQHGVPRNNEGLPGDLWTLPERARAAGCETSAIGKMHFHPTYMDAGFDEMVLAEQNGQGRLVDDYHAALLGAGLVDGIDLIDQHADYRRRANTDYWSSYGALSSDLPESWHSTTWIGDRGLERVGPEWADGGQLMYLSFIKPHHPFDPPRRWAQMYDPDALTILPGWTPQVPPADPYDRFFDDRGLTEGTLRRVMALYYGAISQIDFQVGRIVARLRKIGAYENTLIVFTADHGEYLGYHHLLLKGGPMYEPLMRVPMIVKPPGGPVGIADDRLVSGVDVVPTALAALGIDVPDDLPGRDLLDTWRRDAIVAESQTDTFMVRSGSYKLLMEPDQQLLFDLTADPTEMAPTKLDGVDRDGGHSAAAAMAAELRIALQRQPERRPGCDPVRPSISRRSSSVPDSGADRLDRFDELLSVGHPWLDQPSPTN